MPDGIGAESRVPSTVVFTQHIERRPPKPQRDNEGSGSSPLTGIAGDWRSWAETRQHSAGRHPDRPSLDGERHFGRLDEQGYRR
jgi:hypothetical protein